MFPLFVIFTLFPILSLSQNIQQFNDCTTKLYSCGETIRSIGYPFWGHDRPFYCGLPEFHLTCRDDGVTTVRIIDTTFRVLSINQSISRITIALDDLWQESDACSLRQQTSMNNNSFEQTVFAYIPGRFMFLGLHLSCVENENSPIPIRNRLNCSGDEIGRVSFFRNGTIYLGRESCVSEIIVPVLKIAFDEFMQGETTPLTEVLKQGFPIEYKVDGGGICFRCEGSGGTCWANTTSMVTSCLCPNGLTHSVLCPGSSGLDLSGKLGTTWNNIIRIGTILDSAGMEFLKSFVKKIGDDKDTKLWKERWAGNGVLQEYFQRLYRLETNKEVTVADRGEWINGNWQWKWEWSREPRGRAAGDLEELMRRIGELRPEGNGKDKTEWSLTTTKEFNVKCLRKLIEQGEGGMGGNIQPTLWSRIVPKKVAIFIWRVRWGRVPCRSVLDASGLDLESVLCPICGEEPETVDHALVSCPEVRKVLQKTGRWWRKNLEGAQSVQDILEEDDQTGKNSTIWSGVKWAFLYLIWYHRNNVVFKGDTSKVVDHVFEFQRRSFEWIKRRESKLAMDWTRWLTDPTE